MERVITQDERIRRAEEIYARRQNLKAGARNNERNPNTYMLRDKKDKIS